MRLRSSPSEQGFGLREAFRTLGMGPSRAELRRVADLLRASEVEVDYGDELVETAVACGSNAFVALDLAVARYGSIEPRSERRARR